MGVGAAIAAGSHAENGICALFVIAAVNNNSFVIFRFCTFDHMGSFVEEISQIIATSPARFVYIVTSLDLILIWFW